ncbi:hypothetical protein QWJ34_13770 [Saccharibacillus sp. CPCC 101409]|uniref:hypothetical protein n=1 Tax=Saccharibacillus sp. CPCC 101409 TaxID=3058041 RepID=UPI002673643B|nr:hypothetical protein [Saccharibacillus sp. CPCC 101409]MDO3410836.1 hypothetical protein [Saccharibacillus sp. CPCC 101409]
MNRIKLPGMRKWLPVALACTVTLGGVALSPFSESSVYAASSAEQSAVDWTSPARSSLLRVISASARASDDFYSDPDNAKYVEVKSAVDRARALLQETDVTSTKLASAERSLSAALDAYIKEYIRDASILERQTFQTARMLSNAAGTTPGKYPQQAVDAMLAVIDQAQAVAYDPNATPEQLRSAYRKYVDGFAVLQESRIYDQGSYAASLDAKRQNIQARLSELQSREDFAKLTASFEAHAAGLDRLLAANATQLAVEGADRAVQSAYEALTEGLNLAADLAQARSLMDSSPKGIRSGQYPSSAFGELRRAINQAASSLSGSAGASKLTEARASLGKAVEKFKSTVHA